MVRIIALVIGYVCGLFQTAFIYGKLHGVDIRDYGSGNAGTTNVLRTFGKKAGIIVYLGDCLKAVISAAIIAFTIGKSNPDIEFLLIMYGGLGVVLGHNFPFYMGFKGGKGIAATSGVILSMLPYNWLIVVIGAASFFGVTFISKYVSLGSLVFVTVVLIEIITFGQLGTFDMSQSHLIEAYIVTAVITILAFVRHKENIKRLLSGTERKIFQKKKQEQ
jgi:glycerol-3-phosphate acyltransferase PlsY